MMPDPAKFNKRVIVQYSTVTPDGQGGKSEAWTEFLTAWASVSPTTSKETYAWGRILMESQYTVTMRYRHGIRPKYRLLYDGREFDINSVIDVDERGLFLVLGCIERA